jgi:predicted nuclease of predicted toxin-antitoxin system
VTASSDVGVENASDAEAWKYSSAKGLIALSKDDDFVNTILKSGRQS